MVELIGPMPVTPEGNSCSRCNQEVDAFLILARDVKAEVAAMERFILESGLIQRMGCESCRIGAEHFDSTGSMDAFFVP
ncbi:MAG: hypothetical protein QXI12_04270 [Candidatus Methanomethyliaceae archaeon]